MKKIIYFLFFILLTSCLVDGTDTGNPGFNNSQPTIGHDPVSVEFSQLLTTVCDKLLSCGEFSNFICEYSILNQTNIDTEIGLLIGEYPSLKQVDSAVAAGSLVISQTQLTQCRQDIDLFNCTDPEVQNAFNESSTNPYEGVADMLPMSCETLF